MKLNSTLICIVKAFVCACAAGLATLGTAMPAQADSCTINWNTDSSGNFNVAGNWDQNRVPGGGDKACVNRPSADPLVTIPAGYTVTLASLTNRETSMYVNGAIILTGTDSIFANTTFLDRCSGSLTVAAGATLALEGNTADFSWSNSCPPAAVNVDGTLNKTGGGTSSFTAVELRVGGGVLSATQGTLAMSNGSLISATLNAGVSGTVSIGGYVVASGTLSGGGAGRVELAGYLVATGTHATLNFPSGLFQWTGGYIDARYAPISNTGFIQHPSGTANFCGDMRNTGTVDVEASILFDVQTANLNNLSMGTINLRGDSADLTWNAQCYDAWPISQNVGILRNEGTLNKTGGGESILVNVQVRTIGGTVHVISGTLRPGNQPHLFENANIVVDAGALINADAAFGAGYTELVMSGTVTGTGAGELRLAQRLRSTGSGARLNFAPGWLTFGTNGAQLVGYDAPITNVNQIDLPFNASLAMCGVFDNLGVINIRGTWIHDLRHTRLNNAPNGVINLFSDGGASSNGAISWGSCSASISENDGARIVNRGRIIKDGAGQGAVINNVLDVIGGSIEVLSGTLGGTGLSNFTTIYQNATVNVAAGAEIAHCSPAYVDGTLTGEGAGRVSVAGLYGSGGGGDVNMPPGMLHVRPAGCGYFPEVKLDGTVAPLTIGGALHFDNQTLPIYGVVRADPGAQFVGSTTAGRLVVKPGAFFDVRGTLTNPVLFRGDAAASARGIWNELQFEPGSSGRLHGCEFRNGGRPGISAALWIRSDDVQVSNCTFAPSTNSAWSTNVLPVFRNNSMEFFELFGADNSFINQPLDARGNWWGHPSGPFHPTKNPGGRGITVTDWVLFDPWLIIPPAANNPDLRTGLVQVPTAINIGATVPLTFVVRNVGETLSPTVSWVDHVYASADEVYDSEDVLVAVIPHAGGLANNATYTMSASFVMPIWEEGPLRILVVADGRHGLPDANPVDNGKSARAIASVPELALGGSVSGATGDGVLYKLTPNCTQDVRITLSSPASGAAALARTLMLPTHAVHDWRGTDFVIPRTCAVQYIRVSAGENGVAFTLSAQPVLEAALTVASASPATSDGPLGERDMLVTLSGSGFQPTSTVSLFMPDGAPWVNNPPYWTASVAEVFHRDNGTLLAQVKMQINPTGTLSAGGVTVMPFRLGVSNGSGTVLASQVLTATGGSTCVSRLLGGPLKRVSHGIAAAVIDDIFDRINCALIYRPVVKLALNAPGAIRSESEFPVTIEYENATSHDAPATVLVLDGENATYRFPNETGSRGSRVLLLATNPDATGPVDVIPAGARGTIVLIAKPITGGTHVGVPQTVSTLYPALPRNASASQWTVNVDSLLRAFKPAWMDEYTWTAGVLARLPDMLPQMTPVQFERAMRARAVELARLGVRTHDGMRMIRREVEIADDFGELSTRHLSGVFGHGLPDVTVMRVYSDSLGNRILQTGPIHRIYFKTRLPFEWVAQDDPTTRLTESSGEATIRSADGSSLQFNGDGLLRRTEDAHGNWVDTGYAGGLPVSYTSSGGDQVTISYNLTRVVAITNASGEVTRYGYDLAGDYINVITAPAGVTKIARSLDVDPRHRYAVLTMTNPSGNSLNYSYDVDGFLVREAVNGALEPVTYTRSGLYLTATNALGRQTVIQRASANLASRVTDPLGGVIRAVYGEHGDATLLASGNGTSIAFDYDASGRIRRAVDTAGRATTFAYDARGNTTSHGDAKGNTSRFEYDAQDKLTRVLRTDNTYETYGYNARGLVVTATNRSGVVTNMTYDARLRLSTMARAGESMHYAYDARGNITQVVELASGMTKTTTLSYDSGNRLTRVGYPNGRQVLYSYGPGGQLDSLGDGTGFLVQYSRLPNGKLHQIRDASNTVLVTYSYNAAGELTREDRANGTATTYESDAVGNVTQITHLGPGNVVQESIGYTYDALRRRVQMTNNSGVTRYQYDTVGQLISATLPGGRTLTWAYDANGNRTASTDNGVPTAYAVDEMNRYTSVAGAPATYDPDGRLLSHGATTYSWNPRGQLTAMTAPGETWTFEYDVFGNRSAATRNGVRKEYLVDVRGTANVLAEYDQAGSVLARFVHGYGLVGRVDGTGNAFYGFDGSGNVVNMTGSSGIVANSYRYLPFGEVDSASESVANPFQFGGRDGMMRAGPLAYARARYVRNDWGRFLNEEPLKQFVLNSYVYAHNNPVGYMDSDGNEDYATKSVKNGFFDLGIGQGLIENGLWALDKVNDVAHSGIDVAGGAIKYFGAIEHQMAESQLAQTAIDRGHTAVKFLTGQVNKANARAAILAEQAASNKAVIGRFAEPIKQFGVGLTAGEALFDVSGALGRYMGDPTEENDALLKQEGFKGIAKILLFEVPFAGTIIDKFVAAGDDAMRRGGGNKLLAAGWAWWYSTPDPFGPAAKKPGAHTHDPDQRTSGDPNEIVGPAGVGAQGWLRDGRYVYIIRFENVSTATANAAMVYVTHTLDADLDPLSVELLGYGFGSVNMAFGSPRGLIDELVDVRQQFSVTVRVTATLAPNGSIQWRFNSLDPATGAEPLDSLLGFLPPNNAANDGQGYVMFSVRPKASTPTGAQFRQSARIYFDDNAPIDTNTHVNTLDKDAPTCTVNTLPATTSATSFNVSWQGSDVGGGVHAYFVLTASTAPTAVVIPAWSLWQEDVPITSSPFSGSVGEYYNFICVAEDEAGNFSAAPLVVDTATEIVAADTDGDTIPDATDNCPAVANADQLNTDGDPQGNACDPDDDNDNLTDAQEATLGTNPLLRDTDADGQQDDIDPFPLDPRNGATQKKVSLPMVVR